MIRDEKNYLDIKVGEADTCATCLQFTVVFLMLNRRKHKNCELVPLGNHTHSQATGGKQVWEGKKKNQKEKSNFEKEYNEAKCLVCQLPSKSRVSHF